MRYDMSEKEEDNETSLITTTTSTSSNREEELESISKELEENKQKMRETLGYSLDEFKLSENLNMKPSANFAEELLRLIQANLEPFDSDHCFGLTHLRSFMTIIIHNQICSTLILLKNLKDSITF